MHPVRQAILEILKRKSHATVAELAEELEMAPVSVRHHLDLLIGDGLVSAPRVRRGAGAGRPKRVYALTPEAAAHFPNNYRQLADISLSALKQVLPDEEVLAVMTAFAARTAAQAPEGLGALPLSQRIEAVAQFLSQRGYMADCECADEGVAVLQTCNCPYAQVASVHPELCYMDLHLISALMQLEPQQIDQIVGERGRCLYRFHLSDISSAEKDLAPALVLENAANV